ncbi:hypothetical protein PDESU_04428 [Pontiella desulfatans]|uniref:Uncharacterized protein n=1 Tax=Pontiella desulfatans TaxID=2750659 RepID=A0A6C2U8L0_PONDE|nr:hypothetical protein [Pontiella desulfatans]VGO15841.1 hypothetical protein PDESU_04428 [Pontiella desulfatans]
MRVLFMALLLIVVQGCVTTEESYEASRDLGYTQEVERELKTEEDWERWRKQQRRNKNAIIVIE